MRKLLLPILMLFFLVNNIAAQEQKTIITGRILNFNPEKRQVRIIVNKLGLESERYYTKLTDSGLFKIKLKKQIHGDAWFNYNNVNFLFLVNPNNDVHIEMDNQNKAKTIKSVKFGGNNAISNMKVLKFQIMTNFNLITNDEKIVKAKKHLNPLDFTKFMDSINKQQLSLYNDFLKNEKPNKEVENWAFVYAQEPYNYCMYWYPEEHSNLNNLSEWRVPISFYDYQAKNLPLKKEQLISTYQIGMFTNQFLFGYVNEHIYEDNKEVIKNNPESIDENSLWVKGILKYTKDPLLKQLVLTERLRRNLDKKDISMYNDYQQLVLENITEPFLLKPLQQKYKAVKEQIENPLMASNAILKDARGTNIQSIIDTIISKNKGKIIYIDVWGPWCSPCVKELPHSKKLMKELGTEKIAYVFLCIDSNYKRWKAKLSELKLEGQHYFFDKKQSTELRKLFKINGVPRHLLINKQGIITDQYAKKPSNPQLKKELFNLMEI